MRAFITATGTGVGKTVLTCALTRALYQRGHRIVALKPLETGCQPDPLDAIALAEAAQWPELADLSGLYRARRPLAPWAATLAGEPALDFERLAQTLARYRDATHLLVEGAGGLLVPLDETRTISDLALELELPLIVVAHDGLGVLSHTLTALETARHRGHEVLSVVLRAGTEADPSTASNLDILRHYADVPVHPFPEVNGAAEIAAAGEALLTQMQPSP